MKTNNYERQISRRCLPLSRKRLTYLVHRWNNGKVLFQPNKVNILVHRWNNGKYLKWCTYCKVTCFLLHETNSKNKCGTQRIKNCINEDFRYRCSIVITVFIFLMMKIFLSDVSLYS